MTEKRTVPGTIPILIADLTCAANGSYTENYIRALCERAAEAIKDLESVRSEALESLSDLIKVLENVHDSHKRKGLPLTNSQFAKLNKARSIIHALNAAPPVSSRTQMPENSGQRPAVAAPALSPARVAEDGACPRCGEHLNAKDRNSYTMVMPLPPPPPERP